MTDPCFDAEVLAAWADRTLDERARAEVERHAAQCARCQAMLAAFVRAEPNAAAAAPVVGTAPWWQSLRLRWLVPIAAAATAVAIWIAVPSGPRLESDVAMAPEQTPEQTAPAPLVDKRDPADATRQPPARTEPPAPVGAAPDAAPLAKEADRAAEEAPREPAVLRESADTLASTAERRAAPAAPAAAAEADAQTRSRTAVRSGLADTAVTGFASRDGVVRWRLAGPAVERSTDGGATWNAVTLAAAPARNEGAAPRPDAAGAAAVAAAPPAPAVGAVSSVAVVAGDAPAAAVCWLVGPRGAVWLTVDGGQRFRRMTVTGEPDLRAVTARDARSADVTASDGRVFRTDDAGVSWKLTSP